MMFEKIKILNLWSPIYCAFFSTWVRKNKELNYLVRIERKHKIWLVYYWINQREYKKKITRKKKQTKHVLLKWNNEI